MMSLLRAHLCVLKAWLDLRRFGFERVAAHWLNRESSGFPGAEEMRRARLWSDLLARTSLAPWSTCLTRSIAFCRHAPDPASVSLKIGVRTRQNDRLTTHAWVEMGPMRFESAVPETWLK